MFNELGDGSYQELLQRRLRILGDAPAPSLTPEIFPGIILENDRPEWGFLRGERLCVAHANSLVDLTNLSAITITNPVGSGALVVISSITYQATTTAIAFRRTLVPGFLLPFFANSGPRDFRAVHPVFPNGRNTIAEVRTGVMTPGVAAGQALLWIIFAAGIHIHNMKWILPPGQQLLLHGEVVNVSIQANIEFYERAALPGELV